MADFCRQCALENGFLSDDFQDMYGEIHPDNVLETGEGFFALCEGCGSTLVDWAGQCISVGCTTCKTPETIYQTREQYLQDKEKLNEVFLKRGEKLDAYQQQIYGQPY